MIDKVIRYFQLQNNITKNNTGVLNKNVSSTRLNYNRYRSKDMFDKIIHQNSSENQSENDIKGDMMLIHMLLVCITFCLIGYLSCGIWQINRNTDEIKNGLTECRSIINTFKEVNITLSEIKAHIVMKNKLNEDRAKQLLKSINYSNKMNNFNNNTYLLDHLEIFLNVLSLLSNDIYNSNSLLKNEINKTLDVINNTKAFYETLISFNNNTKNMNAFAIVQFLQNAIDKIHHTSHSLLIDLVKKISNIMLNIHSKYSKMGYKLNEQVCYLKSMLPEDNEFLKQLTAKSQLLSNYEKYCYLKNTSMKFNGKANKEQDTKTNDKKKQTKRADDSVLQKMFEEKDTQTADAKICCDKITNDYSYPTIIGQCIDETLNHSFDETRENTKITSDNGKITTNKTKIKEPMPNNYSRSNDFAKKVSNTDKPVRNKNIPPKIKKKDHVPKLGKSHKNLFKDEPVEQDHHQMKSADWLFKRSNGREKLRKTSNTYLPKVRKASELELEIDASIHDMIEKFGENIDKTLRLLKQKMEQVLEERSFFKRK
ncbi:uncharacterized protein LOC105180487 isoform X2 [Harpegnathos saltator]|nr:uncharacterized protein LOC105180487 isoform X2 [Harpegnathos saltator]